jgi:hypothetical protein
MKEAATAAGLAKGFVCKRQVYMVLRGICERFTFFMQWREGGEASSFDAGEIRSHSL